MITQISNKSLFALGLSMFSVTALAQVSAYRETVAHPSNISVELKPFPTALSFAPGVASIGLGAEFAGDGHAATFADVYMLNANLPNRLRNEGRESEVPVIQKMQGYSGDLGARYYGNANGVDSWYGGAKLSYGFAQAQWGYKEEKIDQSVRTLSPGLEAGYRWVWSNNLLLRAGVGADSNLVQQNEASAVDRETAVTGDAEDKVKGYAKVAVTPRLDMGLGYAF